MSTQKLETIYESAAETAKKIRKVLKVNFPQTKFSIRSQTYSGGSSVSVRWSDLPLNEEVEKVVNQFKSGSFNGMEDIYESTGYLFEGKKYNGAKYIQCSRNLSDEYKETIENYMNEHFAAENKNSWEYHNIFNKAEKQMIEEMNHPKQDESIENNLTIETEQILINDSKLIGRKVFGQWGIDAGWNYGIITGENIYNEVIVNWEDWEGSGDGQYYYCIKDLIIVNEDTSLDPIGVYLMPIEANLPKHKGIILDFNSKLKAKQEKQEIEELTSHFIDNILPYLTNEEIDSLQQAYTTKDNNKFNQLLSKLMLSTAVKRAAKDVLKQN